MASRPDLSVVIPVSGRHGFLARCLETILRQRALRRDLCAEIIVIDNSREPHLREATIEVCRHAADPHPQARARLEYMEARHPNLNHRNASYVLNVGLRHAAAPVVLICACDILHVTETLAQHCERQSPTPFQLVFSFCRDCPADIPLDQAGLERATEDTQHPLRMAACTNWYGGMCCSMPRDGVIQLGGFEERFSRWGYEDYDLARRLLLGGVPVIRDDAIRVLHQAHPSSYRGAAFMKLYAGVRQLLRIKQANHGRPWGIPHPPDARRESFSAAETFGVEISAPTAPRPLMPVTTLMDRRVQT